MPGPSEGSGPGCCPSPWTGFLGRASSPSLWAHSAWHPARDLQTQLNLPHACSAPLHKTLYIPTLLPGVIYYLHHLYCKHTRRALEFSLEFRQPFHVPVPESILNIPASSCTSALLTTQPVLCRAVLPLYVGEGLFTHIMQLKRQL